MSVTFSAAIAYFDGLPRHCLPALQGAWDKVSAGKFSKGGIHKSLCKDFDEVGEANPPALFVNAWIWGVERGEIERPAREISRDKATSETQTLDVAIADAATGEAVRPIMAMSIDHDTRHVAGILLDAVKTAEPGQAVSEGAMMAVRTAAGKLLEDTIIQLSGSIERTARENTARMLRAMADEMEGGAV